MINLFNKGRNLLLFYEVLFKKKKGELTLNEIIIAIISVVVLVVLFVAAMIFFKGEKSILTVIKDIFRFGRA